MNQLKNKYLYLAFGVGLLLALVTRPSKEVIKKEIEYKDKIVVQEIVKWQKVEVVKEVVKFEKIKSSKTKTTFPDGTIIENEVYESETEQLSRLKQLEEEKYNQMLAQKETEYKEKYSKVTLNPKKLSVYGLVVNKPGDLDFFYGGGASYDIGTVLNIPITIGGQLTNNRYVGATIGVRF